MMGDLISVHTDKGGRLVEASYASGCFAAHPDTSGDWMTTTVTHLPTGLALCFCQFTVNAPQVIDALNALSIDWQDVTNENVSQYTKEIVIAVARASVMERAVLLPDDVCAIAAARAMGWQREWEQEGAAA